jgi:ribonuclease D
MIVADLPIEVLDYPICAIDTETDTAINGLDHRVSRPLCIQYASALGEFLVPLKNYELPRHVRALLESKDILKIFHHAQFDCTMLQYNYLVRTEYIACTRILAQVLDPQKVQYGSHSLQSLLDQVLGIKLAKDHRIRVSDWSVLSDEQVAYAMLDVRYLIQLYSSLAQDMTIEHEDRYFLAMVNLPKYVDLKCLPFDVMGYYEYNR